MRHPHCKVHTDLFIGDLVSQEYREMVTQFKEQFATLRKSFNASVAVESFNMALNQGGSFIVIILVKRC